MSEFPMKLLVDTNVPITANLAIAPNDIPDELTECVDACCGAIAHVKDVGGLVMDSDDEIFKEYLRNLSLGSHQPGLGDTFLKWVHDNRFRSPLVELVPITKRGESYDEFPDHEGLIHFDISDRKFIATANAHAEKPPILQATDSKWWGWNAALIEVGIDVHFLCPGYVRSKYEKKMGP